MNSRANGTAASSSFGVGDWLADPTSCSLTRNGSQTKLSPRAMDVLARLADRAGSTVTHEELLESIWHGRITSSNAVHKVIAELRQALSIEDCERTYIETVPKRGYRLVAPVNRDHVPTSRSSISTDATELPNQLAQDGASRRRTWVAAIVVGAVVCSGFAWLTSSPTGPRPRTIELADRSALLAPAHERYDSEERRAIEAVFDAVAARLTARGGRVTSKSTATDVDYVVELEVDQTNGRMRSITTINAADPQMPSRNDQVDTEASDTTELVERTATELSEDLAVLLDAAEVAKMRVWRAANVRAYRLARQAEAFQRITTVESLNHAVQLYQESIRADASFAYAYESLAGTYWSIALTPPDNATRERARRALQALARDAKTAPIDAAVAATVDRRYRMLSVGNAFDSEALWRHELLANPNDIEALRRYGELLTGAKLIDESEQYFQRATSLATQLGDQQLVDAIGPHYGPIAEVRGDWERAIEISKVSVDRFPDFTIALYSLVLNLGKLGRYAEADIYLGRLRGSDPAWAWAAEAVLRAERGDVPKGSQALRDVLDDPRTTNGTRGWVCFTVGDVDCGVHYWRDMEAAFLPLQWLATPSQEQYWAPGVVQDPRYQALLDELGVGKKWRRYMRARAAEMAPVTGIEVTTPPPPEDIEI